MYGSTCNCQAQASAADNDVPYPAEREEIENITLLYVHMINDFQ